MVQAQFQVVKLPPEEWRAYKQIRLEALQREPRAFGASYAESVQRPDASWEERLAEAVEGKNTWLLFARDQERVIGMIGAFRREESGLVQIVAVYVSKECQGQGAGAALMEAILTEISLHPEFHRARLGVTAEQAAAVALYKKYGFHIVKENTDVMGDGLSHLGYIMEKALV